MKPAAMANLSKLKQALALEMQEMLAYWQAHTIDHVHGGFWGTVNNQNIPDQVAPKGVVMYSRILWAFSAAFNQEHNPAYLSVASIAYQYICLHFADKVHEGVYWSVDANGKMLDGRKQVYGQAFAIYGMAEYFRATGDQQALELSKRLFHAIEQFSFETVKNGYIEAFTREWKSIDDLRLSEKDNNERKTMNTHLHIVEAYANLYSVWPDEKLRERVVNLLQLFDQHFIDHQSHHLRLFFDDNWQSKSSLISYGHDIEAAWLLQQCAEIIADNILVDRFKVLAVSIAAAAAEGMDADGGMWYEYKPSADHLVREKHWWPQAEAMVGFMNAYQLTGDARYHELVVKLWDFILLHLKDKQLGEWFWGVDAEGRVIDKEKAGFWKCPYHTTRCFIEMNRRIDGLIL